MLDSSTRIQARSIDWRSLAVCRFMVAVFCFYELLMIARHPEFYSAELGLFKAEQLRFNFSSFTVYFLAGIGMLSTLFYLKNKFTRVSILCLLIVFHLFHLQYTSYKYAGDNLRNLILIVLMIIHLNLPDKFKSFRGIIVQVVLLQLGIIYGLALLTKLPNPAWGQDFTALKYISNQILFYTGLTSWLNLSDEMLKGLTVFTLIFEALLVIGIIALFICRSQQIRLAITICAVLFHLFLGMFLELGMVSHYSIAFWVLLVPGMFWDKLKIFPGRESREVFETRAGKSSAVVLLLLILSGVYADFNEKSEIQSAFRRYQLTQTWSLFAATDATEEHSFWPLFVGVYSDGSKLNLINGENVFYGRPDSAKEVYPNTLYKHFFMEHLLSENKKEKKNLQKMNRYLCKTANFKTNQLPVKIELSMMRKDTQQKIEQKKFFSFTCPK